MGKLPAIIAVTIVATPLFVLAEGSNAKIPDRQNMGAGAEKAKDTGALTQAEADVLRKLHHANTMEVEAGNLAKTRGDAKGIKNYGAELVKDHTKADSDVLKLAKSKTVVMTAPMPKNAAEEKQGKDEMARMSRLRELKGADFDREFVNMMLSDHERDIQFVRDSRAAASDVQLKMLLEKMLPVLEKHRDDAQALMRKEMS